jgi:hypothetical protein
MDVGVKISIGRFSGKLLFKRAYPFTLLWLVNNFLPYRGMRNL